MANDLLHEIIYEVDTVLQKSVRKGHKFVVNLLFIFGEWHYYSIVFSEFYTKTKPNLDLGNPSFPLSKIFPKLL